ncbi:MAG: hypothetical protein ACHP84_02505 [Caulobacterales bacterium]
MPLHFRSLAALAIGPVLAASIAQAQANPGQAADATPATAAPAAGQSVSQTSTTEPPNATTRPGGADVAATPPAHCCHVPVGTIVEIELVDALSAKVQKPTDKFGIRLSEPLVIDGVVVMRAGALGQGEVIDAAPPGMGGRAAKLILAARYVEQDGVRLPLRSLKLGGSGKGSTGGSIAVAEAGGLVFGPLAYVGLAVKGGNVDLPAGTHATAKVAADLDLAPAAPPLDSARALPAPQPEKGTTP